MNTENKGNNKDNEICLEIRDIVKRFPGIIAVDKVDLQVHQGEIFTFLGPSGCGKSTLLRIIAGLDIQDQGDVLINNRLVNKLPPFKRDCSTVFQNHALFPHMKVKDNVGFGLVERKIAKKEIKRRVGEKIDLVNLQGMADRYPHQLSGGQRQRVALARSLVLEPAVLLLDEPLAALDRKLRKEMQIELKRIQREVGTTFLNVTHDQKEALSLSDRIAIMEKGKLRQAGAPDELYERPRSRFVASFMGAMNIFTTRVISHSQDQVELEISNEVRVSVPNQDQAPISDIKGFSIHPELIRIHSAEESIQHFDTEKLTLLKGIISEVFYQGDYSEISVSLEGTSENLTLYLNRGDVGQIRRVPVGREVMVSWESRHNNLLVG